jgi:signal transduction histidine kinase
MMGAKEALMTDPGFAFPVTNTSARLQTWRWLLPLTLFTVVLLYETLEHILAFEALVSASLWWELLLFGLAAPLTVGIALNWITRQVRAREEAEAQLRQLVAQLKQAEEEVRRANTALERKVAERTQSLLKAYQKVAEQNEALQALDRLKSEFVSLVSHELRAPLTNINGGLELILAFGDDLGPDIRDSLQVMGQESQRLTRFVENILNVSALEAGQLQLNLGPVALPPLIDRTIECHLVGAPNHRFQVDIQDDLPMVRADEACMYDILYNLIDNAVKYSAQPESGEINVAAGYDRATDKGEGDTIWISVVDNGPGILPKDQEKIFDPFHRLDGGENHEVYGYGLGLYFARKLVEAQDGEIWLESEPGQGSRFTLTLPIVPSASLEGGTRDEPDDSID